MPTTNKPARIVVLVSGSGTNLQALIDATAAPDFGATIVAVGSDRANIEGLQRAEKAAITTFITSLKDFASRDDWDHALTHEVAAHDPDLVVLAGFMRLVGPEFLKTFGGITLNTHPALSPSFPGVSGPADALAYGVKITGATLFLVDDGIDTGIIIDQTAVRVEPHDTAESLHERIKIAERSMLVECIGRMVRHGWDVNDRWVSLR